MNQQSGIQAGDGGFQLKVAGDTELTGAVITSTDEAINNNRNSLDTASIQMQDITNHSRFSAEAFSVGTGGAGYGSDGEKESSVTQSGVSGLAGNTNARTGDASTGLQNNFDADKVQREIDSQTAITGEFGKQAPKAWADYAGSQQAQLTLAALKERDPERRQALLDEASQWGEGGTYHLAGHAVLGGLTGGVSGVISNTSSVAAMAELGSKVDAMDLPDSVKSGLNASLAAGLGAITGDLQGATQAINSELNNRQLHSFEKAMATELAKDSPYTPEQIENALRAMSNQELNEIPGSNLVVNENNPELAEQNNGVATERFDEGGTWIQTGDGIQVQLIPKDIDPALASFIISQTGGEDSPYSLPVYTPSEGIMTYQRDPIRGARIVDENGQYTVVHVVEGQYFNIKHWPCHKDKCDATIPDPKSPNYDAWVTAQNIKAAKDAATVAGGAAGLMRAGLLAETVGTGSTVVDLYADYMSGDGIKGLSAAVVQDGFESGLKRAGVPSDLIIKISSAIGSAGGFDRFIDLYADQLGDR